MAQMLGRLPVRRDYRNLQFAKYLLPTLPPLPDKRLWQTPVSNWGVMGNDSYGNCVIVTTAHMLLAWRANELQDTRRITDAAVIDLSRTMGALNGYNILDRLLYWRKTGMFADRLWAFTEVTPAATEQVQQAINLFGCLDIGVNLPSAWQGSDEWDVGSGRAYRPGSWGGHSVPLVGYDASHVFAVTWGDVVPMTWEALAYYSDEAYACIDKNWLAGDAVSPAGFDLESLHADLKQVSADE